MSYIVAHQQPNGWLGPTDSLDAWGRFPLLLAMAQYAEAFPEKTEVTVDSMFNFTKNLQSVMLGGNPLGVRCVCVCVRAW